MICTCCNTRLGEDPQATVTCYHRLKAGRMYCNEKARARNTESCQASVAVAMHRHLASNASLMMLR